MKAKGKKITRAQRDLLLKYRLDPNEYLYVKQIINQPDSSTRKLNKVDTKETFLVFVNINTGEQKILEQ